MCCYFLAVLYFEQLPVKKRLSLHIELSVRQRVRRDVEKKIFVVFVAQNPPRLDYFHKKFLTPDRLPGKPARCWKNCSYPYSRYKLLSSALKNVSANVYSLCIQNTDFGKKGGSSARIIA